MPLNSNIFIRCFKVFKEFPLADNVKMSGSRYTEREGIPASLQVRACLDIYL
jgi:hypothetical protein